MFFIVREQLISIALFISMKPECIGYKMLNIIINFSWLKLKFINIKKRKKLWQDVFVVGWSYWLRYYYILIIFCSIFCNLMKLSQLTGLSLRRRRAQYRKNTHHQFCVMEFTELVGCFYLKFISPVCTSSATCKVASSGNSWRKSSMVSDSPFSSYRCQIISQRWSSK